MPIHGLTTGGEGKLPIIGQIRKGDKTPQGYPKELDHFRVVFNPAEEEAAAIFRQVYGDTPRQIRVMFPVDAIDRVWDAWLLAFQGKTLVAKSDGERYLYKVDTDTGNVVVENGHPPTPYYRENVEYSYTNGKGDVVEVRCSPRARMYVLVKELFEAGYLACLEFHTGSYNDIRNLSDQITMMNALARGHLAYTPMLLSMYPETILRSTQNGRKVNKETHLVKLEVDPSFARLALAKLQDRSPAPALEAGDDWEPELDEEPSIEGEFTQVGGEDHEEQEDLKMPQDTSGPGSWTEFWERVKSPGFPIEEKAVRDIVQSAGKDLTKAWQLVKQKIAINISN